MKMILAAISIIFNCLVLQAQQVDVTLYPEMKNWDPMLVKYKNDFYAFDIEMQGISGFSANLKRLMHNITLKKYDAEMKETNKERVVAPDKAFGPIPPLLKVMNDKLYLLYYKMSEKKNMTLYAAMVDPATLELAAPDELLSIDDDVRYIEYHMRSMNPYHPNHIIYTNNFAENPVQLNKTFFIESSPDGSKFLVSWTSGWDNNLFYSVFDKDMKKIRTGKETLPDEKSLAFSNACIDNSGNAFFAYSYSKKGKAFAEILINKNGGTSSVKTITIPDGDPFGAYAALDKVSGKLLICGAYKEGDPYLAGVYILSLNTTNLAMGAVSKTAFPKDLVEIFDKEGWGNKNEKKFGLSDGLVLEANMLDNGVMNLTGEFRRTISGTRASFNEAGSILNARFNEHAVVFSRIPKVRVSAGSTFGDTYRAFGYRNSLVIFYNDHLSNINLDLSKTPVRSDKYNNSVLASVVLDSTGLVKREVVIDKSSDDYLVSLETMQEMSRGSYFTVMRRIKGMGGVTSDIKWASLKMK